MMTSYKCPVLVQFVDTKYSKSPSKKLKIHDCIYVLSAVTVTVTVMIFGDAAAHSLNLTCTW